jgi:hypothetical protein
MRCMLCLREAQHTGHWEMAPVYGLNCVSSPYYNMYDGAQTPGTLECDYLELGPSKPWLR